MTLVRSIPTTPYRRLAAVAALGLAAALALAACGSEDEEPSAEGTAGAAIGAERCEANKAAGTITYMSGYYWQASASILEVIAADGLGFFEDLCLDVELQPGPGDVSQNTKLLAAGQVQIGGLSQQDTITANANGLAIQGVSAYSNAGLDILMTRPDVTALGQLEGKTLGHKGWVPMGVSAMLGSAGLAEGDVEQVKVGYDPTILPRGQVDALVGFISNEPGQLEAAGEDVTVWEPKDFGIPGSIGSYAINPAFGESHPTAVEDFLRAVFHAYEYCAAEEHVEECIELQHEQAGPDSDPEHETAVWTKEVSVIADNPLPGGFGVPDLDNVGALAGLISEYGGLAVDAEEAQGWFTTAFAEAVVEDGQAIWPAP